jgi:hypothetical protein
MVSGCASSNLHPEGRERGTNNISNYARPEVAGLPSVITRARGACAIRRFARCTLTLGNRRLPALVADTQVTESVQQF